MKVLERYHQGWLHALGWAIFAGLPFLTLPSFLWNQQDLISIGTSQLLTGIVIACCFYYNLHRLTPNLLNKQEVNRFVVTLLAMLLVVVLVKLACFYTFYTGVHYSPKGRRRSFSPWPGALSASMSFGFVMLLSSLIALGRHHAQVRDQQQQMILGKVSAELAMLKLQVSPHFLFNTLNNIRWLARKKADQTEEAVVKLSQLLRYMLYQAQRDHVSLTKEIEHLHHYIDLQQMRLNDRQTVDFTVDGPVNGLLIEPLLFIPFVENAFKYGLHGQEASHIQIDLDVSESALSFSVVNPLFAASGASSEDSGIGIANVKQRLALHYPDRHTLEYGVKDGKFHVHIVLQLHQAKATSAVNYSVFK
ncbi:sensor histidine kinase [Fibrivirga algicola]|uniref:Sensor protein lytS n=1 Tax=Fibrivirga algicola TaxID=2950420 RepID=A0ABX0QEA4_9BACT|nr:histidine kinase [Fibrivirga algicola]ARK09367.1 sensor protein lytS [Fibrella sp. ES10-3-2-2]NID10238.1 sensor protein lytS [Fibrivirga algicola]